METTPQDNRKHALDALERRFTVAEAELLKQQKKELGSEKERGRRVNILPEHLSDAQGAKSSRVSPWKDAQVVDPTYSVLSQPVNENLLTAPVEISNKKGTRVDRIMHELLRKGDSAQKYMHGSKSMKIDGVILLDNYVKGRMGFVGSRVRALKAQSKRSKIHMSMKKHKKYGFFDLSQDLCLFHLFVPMHKIWKNYMMELLKTSGFYFLFYGLAVAYCKITSFGGANGIMIRETAGAFGLITRDNKFLVVPKKGSVFLFQVLLQNHVTWRETHRKRLRLVTAKSSLLMYM